MLEIESVTARMIRIGDTYIPATNLQIEGFPCVIDGEEHDQYFEIWWENETYIWEVSRGSNLIQVDMRGDKYSLLGQFSFTSWESFSRFWRGFGCQNS